MYPSSGCGAVIGVPVAVAPAVVAAVAVVNTARTVLRSFPVALLLVLRFRWVDCGSLEVPRLEPWGAESCSTLVVDVVGVVELVVVTALPILLPLEVLAADVEEVPRPADESAFAARPSS